MLTTLLILSVAFLAYANGANDNIKAAATVYGSRTLGYKGSLALATAAQLCGSLASVLLAGALLDAFGGKGLVPDATVADPRFLLAVAVAGAGTVLLATRLGFPISTTHALIGGLAGSGLALAPASLSWGILGKTFALPLLVSPLLAVAAAAILYPLASWGRERLGVTAETCVCVGEQVVPVVAGEDGALVARATGLTVEIGEGAECRTRYQGRVLGLSAQRALDGLHVASAFSLGFARGLNDTPKVLGVLLAAHVAGASHGVALAIAAVVMAAGGLLHSRRIAVTMGERITELNHGQGFLANAVSSALVIGASWIGTPVSTTHVSCGAIMGIGVGSRGGHGRMIAEILLAWVITLPVAALLGYAVALLA